MGFELAKVVVSLAADLGTGIIAGDVIKSAIDFQRMSKAKKVLAAVGASAMSLMISDKVSKYVDEKFDESREACKIIAGKFGKEVEVVDVEEVKNEDN